MYYGRCVCDDVCSVRGSGLNFVVGILEYLYFIDVLLVYNSRLFNICILIIVSNKGLSDVLFILYIIVY